MYVASSPSGTTGTVLNSSSSGIRQADSEAAKKQRFNMSGQRVGTSYKGIVIVNGKKFMQK